MSPPVTSLPTILSVFFAVFDQDAGPKIAFQIPEGLITESSISDFASGANSPPKDSDSASASSLLLGSASGQATPKASLKTVSMTKLPKDNLFTFDDIRKFIIPTSALCGRLITCTTKKTHVMGFPVALRGKYERHYFRFNICFVFDRRADLSCFEPIVRKVGRIMKACEESSHFLSNPNSNRQMPFILRQIYEDLNSSGETSIEIDENNMLDLKVFPFYPNPPKVNLWDVPVAFIKLEEHIEPNWDETMRRVVVLINGINSVAKIAECAETDLELTKQAIAHLLYYRCVTLIDIFQYSNMYTLTKDLCWLAEDLDVVKHCGAFVTRPGKNPLLQTDIASLMTCCSTGHKQSSWPELLTLYSHFRAGMTVLQWQEEYGVLKFGIDTRRFTSFGVIKGFLRRVHRWPYLMPMDTTNEATPAAGSLFVPLPTVPEPEVSGSVSSLPTATVASLVEEPRSQETAPSPPPPPTTLSRSFEERLGVLSRRRARERTISSTVTSDSLPEPISNEYSRRRGSYLSATTTISNFSTNTSSVGTSTADWMHSPYSPGATPKISTISLSPGQPKPVPPFGLAELLDGEHHTDELCTRFKIGWPQMKKHLAMIGNPDLDFRGDVKCGLGRVKIIYR